MQVGGDRARKIHSFNTENCKLCKIYSLSDVEKWFKNTYVRGIKGTRCGEGVAV